MKSRRLLMAAASLWLAARAVAQTDDDGGWPMPAKDYASTRYSALAQINSKNASTLRPVWTFSTGVLAGHEGQPLVVGDTMYVVTPWPNVLYAFDLAREGYPLKWKYRPPVSPNAIGVSCCDVINRGAFFADGKIIYNLLDGHTVAVDAKSGREVWMTQIASLAEGETTPMAPFVVKDRVIVGASGGEFGIRGWVKGLDLKTGRILWTAHNLGPDSQMIVRAGTWVAPSLVDGRWRYGGDEEELFQSIFYGRPKGMPAYGGLLGAEGVWAVVMYLKSQPVPAVVPTTNYEELASPAATQSVAPGPGSSSPSEGLERIAQYGCVACHAIDRKVVGPAYRDVAAKYRGDAGAEVRLVTKVKSGGSGVWGAVPMPPHAHVPDAQLREIVRWILTSPDVHGS